MENESIEPEYVQESHAIDTKLPPVDAPNRNFVHRLWRGDVSLPVTYWVFYVLAGTLISFMVTPYIKLLTLHMGRSGNPIWLIYPILVFLLSYQVFMAVSVWRSANKHKNIEKENAVTWAVIAQILVVTGTAYCLGNTIVKISNPLSTEKYAAIIRNMNEDLPKMIDNVTRLDSIQYLDGKTTYNFTFTGSFDKNMQQKIQPTILSNICKKAATRKLLKTSDILLEYRSAEGKMLATVSVTEADCASE